MCPSAHISGHLFSCFVVTGYTLVWRAAQTVRLSPQYKLYGRCEENRTSVYSRLLRYGRSRCRCIFILCGYSIPSHDAIYHCRLGHYLCCSTTGGVACGIHRCWCQCGAACPSPVSKVWRVIVSLCVGHSTFQFDFAGKHLVLPVKEQTGQVQVCTR